jgi:ubiquitin-protein ligase
MITGIDGSPYDSGCFLLGVMCDSSYPGDVPKVRCHSCRTSVGDINPNIFRNGNICLSLLWGRTGNNSEGWIPGKSTIMQIIISIQSIVMNQTPLYNSGVLDTGIKSDQYNNTIQIKTMQIAIINVIDNPYPGFEEAIRKHFILKRDHIKSTYANTTKSIHGNKLYVEMCSKLDNLGDM